MFTDNVIASKTMEYCTALKNNKTDQYVLNSKNIHILLRIKELLYVMFKIHLYNIYMHYISILYM